MKQALEQAMVKRSELTGWVVVPDDKPVYFTDIAPTVENANLVRSIVEGSAKQAILKEVLNNNAEENSVVVFKSGKNYLYATKKYNQGKFCLCPATNAVSVVEKKLDHPWVSIGSMGNSFIYIRSSNTNLKPQVREASKLKSELVAKCWVADAMATDDSRRANCEYHEWSVEISVGKTKVKLNLPKIINTSVLQEEDDILLLLLLLRTASGPGRHSSPT